MALEHGVAPLLYLQTKGQPLPETASAELRRIYRANLARNLALDQERVILQAELMRQAGPVISLKGPQLAVLLYGDPGARQVADVDMLIRPEHLPAADRVLAQHGFVRDAAPLARLRNCRDICYPRQTEGRPELCIDLHLRLRPYGRSDVLVSRLWQEGMTRENLLLYLCLNLMVHRWARLQPLLDIVALRRQAGSLDGERLVASARELEWTAGVHHCLKLASQLAGVDTAPEDCSSLAGSKLQRWWVEAVLGRNVDSLLRRSQMLDGPVGTLALLGCEKGVLGKLRLAGSILVPASATLRQMDAPSASLPLPLHYVQRAGRKTWQTVKTLTAMGRRAR